MTVLGLQTYSRADGLNSMITFILFCVVGKYVAAISPFFIIAVFVIQAYYLRTSRQVRLLDIEAKSPLYTHFGETLHGISTIRAFGWQEISRLRCREKLNESQKPFYMLLCIQQWLSLVLEFLIAVVAVILLAVTTSFEQSFDAGGIGVALNYLLTFNQSLERTVQSWTQLETSIGAVTRIRKFSKEAPSERRHWQKPQFTNDAWLSGGSIDFENLTVAYG